MVPSTSLLIVALWQRANLYNMLRPPIPTATNKTKNPSSYDLGFRRELAVCWSYNHHRCARIAKRLPLAGNSNTIVKVDGYHPQHDVIHPSIHTKLPSVGIWRRWEIGVFNNSWAFSSNLNMLTNFNTGFLPALCNLHLQVALPYVAPPPSPPKCATRPLYTTKPNQYSTPLCSSNNR